MNHPEKLSSRTLFCFTFLLLFLSFGMCIIFPDGVQPPSLPSSCNDSETKQPLWLSNFIGWLYFFTWSISFYPQLYFIQKNKTAQGLSLDFLCINFFAYSCYSSFNIGFYYIRAVTKECFCII